jgi:hypothetical protein
MAVPDSSAAVSDSAVALAKVHDFALDLEHLPSEADEEADIKARLDYWRRYSPKFWLVIGELVGLDLGGGKRAQDEADELWSWICDVHECIQNQKKAQDTMDVGLFHSMASEIEYVTNSLIKPRFKRMLESYADNDQIMLRLKRLAVGWGEGALPPDYAYFFVDKFPFMFEAAFANEIGECEVLTTWREQVSKTAAEVRRKERAAASDFYADYDVYDNQSRNKLVEAAAGG